MKIVVVLICSFLTGFTARATSSEKVSTQIKSCLVDLYIAQQNYFEYNAVYSSSVQDLKVIDKQACKGIQISFEIANKETFVLVGKLNGEHWTLDESKSLTQVR